MLRLDTTGTSSSSDEDCLYCLATTGMSSLSEEDSFVSSCLRSLFGEVRDSRGLAIESSFLRRLLFLVVVEVGPEDCRVFPFCDCNACNDPGDMSVDSSVEA